MRRRTRSFAWCLLAVAVLGAIGVWRAHALADATIARHSIDFRASVARLRASARARPALLQPDEPGDARALAEALYVAVEAIPEADRNKVPEFDPGSSRGLGPAIERAVLSRALPALDGLDGLYHRTLDGSPPADLGSAPFPGSGEIRRIFLGWQALTAAIRHAREDGRADEAIRLACAAVLLGQDLGRRRLFFPAALGLGIQRTGTDALAQVLRDASASPDALAHLASCLGQLLRVHASPDSIWELTWVTLEGVLAEDALFERGLAADPNLRRLRTWRTLYSTRIGRAAALRTLESIPVSVPPELASEPFGTAVGRTISALGLEPSSLLLPEFSLSRGPAWPAYLRGLRRQEGYLAAITLAVALARFEVARGSWPATAGDLVPEYLPAIPTSDLDPTGARFAPGKAWSQGLDGDDDHGRALSDPEALEGDGDLVVEVRGHR